MALLRHMTTHPWASVACGIALIIVAWLFKSRLDAFRHWRSMQRRAKAYAPSTDTIALHGKRLLVLVNPFGGARTAPRIAKELLRPMAAAAGVDVDIVATQRAGHARDIAEHVDTDKYALIVCISGDGMVHEVINGLAARRARRLHKAVDDVTGVLNDIPVCALPGGTSNGTAASTTSADPFEAVQALLEGGPQRVDLFTAVQLGDNEAADDGNMSDASTGSGASGAGAGTGAVVSSEAGSLRSAVWDGHVFSWGIVAEHDHLIERHLRWMPKRLRMLYAPAHVIMARRTHSARVCLLPAQGEVPKGMHYEDPTTLPVTTPPAGAEHVTYEGGAWREIDADDFVLLCGSNMPWASFDCVFSPGLPLSGGSLDLIIMRNPSRVQLAAAFDAMATGAHAKLASVQRYRVAAYTVTPRGPSAPGGAQHLPLDISGEVYAMRQRQQGDATVLVQSRANAGLFWFPAITHDGDKRRAAQSLETVSQ